MAGIKVVYVAGPFRAMNANGRVNCWGVQKNVMAAMTLALEVWKLGAVALCPHSNTMFFSDADGIADNMWLDGDLELVRRCDALILTPDWERSSGARAEAKYADSHNIPVFFSIAALQDWLTATA